MRRLFFQELYKQMTLDEDVFAISGDLGYIGFDKIRDTYPKRFINAGASEQAMLDIAVGLALSGKKPFVYSITPFLLFRGFETIRNYINHEGIAVRLVGSGREDDYERDGFSHHDRFATEMLYNLSNITAYYPTEKGEIPLLVEKMVMEDIPSFLSLRR